MYKTLVELDGIIEDINVINKGIEQETGIADFFDPATNEWRAWVEYKDGKTIVLEEEA